MPSITHGLCNGGKTMKKNKFLALKAKREAEIQRQQQQAAQGPYELSMSFCVDEVNTVVDDYRAEQNLADAVSNLPDSDVLHRAGRSDQDRVPRIGLQRQQIPFLLGWLQTHFRQ